MDIELTRTQRDSVEYKSGDLLVKGVAGSGKSIVLLQRALRFNKKAIEAKEKKRILIITYANSLVNYTQELLNQANQNPSLIELWTIDKCCSNIYRKMNNRGYIKFISKAQDRKQHVAEALQRHLNRTVKKHRFHDMEPEFWADEFLWIKQRDYVTAEDYIKSERIGRGGKIRMTREDKAIAYELFLCYKEIIQEKNEFDWEDCYNYIIKHADSIPQDMRYDYVMVDEAQDLSFAQLKTAKLLARTSVTIAADKAQKIYKTSFTWKELGIDIRGRGSKSLEKSFRSTKQIVQLAESLLEVNRALQEDQSEYTDPIIPEREGTIPTIISCKNAADESDIVIKLIKQYEKDNIIGVLYRSYSEYTTIQRWLLSAGISYQEIRKGKEWSFSKPGAKLSTLHSSKGLEFDVVIIPLFIESVFPLIKVIEDADEEQVVEIIAQERSLLYVGLTRAKYELYLTCSSSPSRFISDFNSEYYQLKSSAGKSMPKPQRTDICKRTDLNSGNCINSQQKVEISETHEGTTIITHIKGETKPVPFVLDFNKYHVQKAFIGKSIGDEVCILSKIYVIDKI